MSYIYTFIFNKQNDPIFRNQTKITNKQKNVEEKWREGIQINRNDLVNTQNNLEQ